MKKKTHLGPKRRVWRRLGPFCLRGLALAFGGRRWLLWAFVVNKMEEKIEKKTHLGPKRRQTRCLGPFSSSWVFVGLRWPSLATQWLLWAFVGLHWPSLAVVGC